MRACVRVSECACDGHVEFIIIKSYITLQEVFEMIHISDFTSSAPTKGNFFRFLYLPNVIYRIAYAASLSDGFQKVIEQNRTKTEEIESPPFRTNSISFSVHQGWDP